MFCKHCGKQIANDSIFCQYCGGKQDLSLNQSESNSHKIEKVEITGNVNANLSHSFPKFFSLIKENKSIVIIYALWFLTNIVLLLSGDGRNHFWPYIHKSGGYYDRYYNGGSYIKETTHVDWDIDYYGWPEFVIYTFLVPLILYVIFCIIKSDAFKGFWKKISTQ